MFSKTPSLFVQGFFIFFINAALCAEVSTTSIETQIIERVAAALFPKQKIAVWGETADQKEMIKQSKIIEEAIDSSNADLIIVSKKIPQNLSKNCVIITTEYSQLIKDERIIGAFFWQKGRPNLLFLRPRMQKANVKLSHEFDKYIEDEL
ncbi:MAG: hypothetical protein Q8S36_07455 [Sulfuricurvum sp.]|nr:hypothetical protein [Sulfuricurvum sp.]